MDNTLSTQRNKIVIMSNPKVPHPHKEVIIAYAYGEQIQMRNIDGVWIDLKEPVFSLNVSYRIKPPPTPDIVVYRSASLGE